MRIHDKPGQGTQRRESGSEEHPGTNECVAIFAAVTRAFSRLACSVSRVAEIVAAFVGAEFGDELSDAGPEGVSGAFGVFAKQRLQLREELFDGVQVQGERTKTSPQGIA